MTAIPGTVAFDEYGRPFIILRNQEKQKRLTGIDAIKVFLYYLNNFFFHFNYKSNKKIFLIFSHDFIELKELKIFVND